jgi:hypothetical protein
LDQNINNLQEYLLLEDMSDRAELRQSIIEKHQQDKSQSDEAIAVEVGASTSYVATVRADFEQGDGTLETEKLVAMLLLLGTLIWIASGRSGAAIQALTIPYFV